MASVLRALALILILHLRCRRLVPDAPLARFRHQEQAEHECDRDDRIDQRVAKAVRCGAENGPARDFSIRALPLTGRDYVTAVCRFLTALA